MYALVGFCERLEQARDLRMMYVCTDTIAVSVADQSSRRVQEVEDDDESGRRLLGICHPSASDLRQTDTHG